MAIVIKTKNPSALLNAIYKAIDDKKVETWSYDADKDFTHVPDQWRNKAWLRPKVNIGELRFGILGQKDVKMSELIYGVFHGRFIEMLLTHFDNDFTDASATAQKAEPDNF
jgi:hypothetical protein